MSGKGDGYRPVDREKFNANWVRIFANKQDRETSSQKTEKASERCQNTIDIEEQIDAEK